MSAFGFSEFSDLLFPVSCPGLGSDKRESESIFGTYMLEVEYCQTGSLNTYKHVSPVT